MSLVGNSITSGRIRPDRVVVITGATGGLGSIVTHEFARQGARLALLSIDNERLAQLAQELDLPEERLLTKVIDLSSAQAAQIAARSVLEKFGRVEILLNLVGGWTGGKTLVEASEEETAFMLQQHLWSTFHLVKAFVPSMTEGGWGRIVVVSSPYANRPAAKGGPYAIGKAAQETLILALAQELRGSGVTANIVQVQTIDVAHARDTAPTAKNASWTTPEEITGAIVYLCLDEAHVVNGGRLPLFGAPL